MRKLLLVGLLLFNLIHSCSNLIATKGATADGYIMFTYNADSSGLFGELYHQPAAKHQAGDKRQIYDWDSGKYLGEIDEAEETYNVIGNMNEYGLAIGETTWGGLEELDGGFEGTPNIMDYGSLIYVTLQRAKTATEAIRTMIDLCNQYGYYSSGESFTIADSEHVWILDVIGKGPYYDEALDGNEKICYVGRRLPDGVISGHANQARITEINLDEEYDESEFIYAANMKQFTDRMNYTKEEDRIIDYSAIFNPLDFLGTRCCDARVYTFFHRAGVEGIEQYNDYIQGKNNSNRMPLWFECPDPTKITLTFMEDAISDHYEDTILDMRNDVGAGPWHWGNRYHPLLWTVNGTADEQQYIHERPIATQQTGWSFIAVMRPMGTGEGEFPLASMFYFGLDDSATSYHVPFYPGITRLPPAFETKTSTSGVEHPTYDMNHFSYDNAFWVNNMVANFAYQDWTHIYPQLLAKRTDLNKYFANAVELSDAEIRRIFAEEKDEAVAKEKAIAYATDVCTEWAAMAHAEWLALYDSLFLEYGDLVRRIPVEGQRDVTVEALQYSQEWYKTIIKYTGDQYYLGPTNSTSVSNAAA